MPPCVCNERCCGKNPAIKSAFLWIIQLFRKPWKFNYSWIVFEIISRSLSSLQSLDKFIALQNVILIILLQLTQCLPHLLWTEIAPFNWLILPIYSKTMLWSCSKCLILSVSFLWRAKCCSIDVKMCWSPNYTLLENRLSSWQCFTSYFLAYLIFFVSALCTLSIISVSKSTINHTVTVLESKGEILRNVCKWAGNIHTVPLENILSHFVNKTHFLFFLVLHSLYRLLTFTWLLKHYRKGVCSF